MPKVSIIVPFYNEQQYIQRCIQSILQSTFKDYEILLIDDGSSDSSLCICNEYAEKNKNVFVYSLDRGGVSKARNYGIEKALGEYIWFVDGDDSVFPDSLEYLVNGIEREECDLVIGKYKSNRKDWQSNNWGMEFVEKYSADFCCGSGFYYDVLWNKLYKKDIIVRNSLQFPEDITFAEDCIFNSNYLLFCRKVFYIDKEVYFYSDDKKCIKCDTTSIEKERMIIHAFIEMLNKKRKLIKSFRLGKKVEYHVNNSFFYMFHNENKILKKNEYNELLLSIWKSDDFRAILEKGSGGKGKSFVIARIAKTLNAFWIYKMIL